MSSLERLQPGGSARSARGSGLVRQTNRVLGNLEHETVVRMAQVQSEGYVHCEKVREVENLTQAALTGHTLLAKWRDTLAGPDPVLHDELTFFLNISRVAQAEIIADAVSRLRGV
jgi:hypothetical protein